MTHRDKCTNLQRGECLVQLRLPPRKLRRAAAEVAHLLLRLRHAARISPTLRIRCFQFLQLLGLLTHSVN
eukprot:SAG11_NODE_2335_length_3504_cov_2.100734_4_plen_70_part_00